jgi:glutamate N-acetyltransferase/amino-acid acetyltransferase
MAVGWKGLPTLQPVAGVRIGTAKAGIKKSDRRDLTVFELAPGSTVAAVFTRNRFCAAPVQLAKQHLVAAAPRYLLINTGNANAGTGATGFKAALACCEALAAQAALQQALGEAMRGSFNRITVDGDTSTNDACILVATGAAGGVELNPGSDGFATFVEALRAVSLELAQAIVRDGEGATKLITVAVSEGANEAECERVAYAVAESPLVKTALFASDPNWGRILAAVGRAGIDDLDVNGVSLYLDDLLIAEHGGRVSNYREEDAAARIAGEEVIIGIRLGRGTAAATVWTCDLSYDYVRINADYRS